MTAVDDRPTTEIGSRAQAQGGPAADHRPHPAGPTTSRCPGCCTSPWCAARSPTRTITAIDSAAGQGRARASSASSPAVTSPRSMGVVAERLADHRRPEDAHPPARSPSTTSPAPARSSPSSPRAAPQRARDAAELVDVDYDELPAVLDAREAAQGRGARAPGPRHEQVGVLAARLGRPRAPAATSTRPSTRRATNGILIEREYRQQRLVPAFMEPRSTVVDPTGEQIVIWTADPDPAHPALPHRRDHRASPSPRSASSPPTSVVASAASCRRPPRSSRRWPSPAGSASPASTPRPAPRRWSRATTAATSGRRSPSPPPRTARSPASRSTCSPTWAPTSASSAAACRCSARGCSTPSTSSPPTSSTARRCSPTRPGSTPTVAPAGPRPPTRSSGSWTSSPPRSASTRWRSARRTGSPTRSSPSPPSPG